MTRRKRKHVNAWHELRQVLQAWRSGEGDLLGLLLTLETRGLVKSLPGKFYVRV